MLSIKRDKAIARRFFRKELKTPHNQPQRVITTDKYLNNIIEQDRRFTKKKIHPMLGFGSLDCP